MLTNAQKTAKSALCCWALGRAMGLGLQTAGARHGWGEGELGTSLAVPIARGAGAGRAAPTLGSLLITLWHPC